MRFKFDKKQIKAGLSQDEINQIKSKFNLSDFYYKDFYKPEFEFDSEAYDELIDNIDWSYLTDEQRERIDYTDYEKILGITEEQFNQNRKLFVEKEELEDKLDKYTNDGDKFDKIKDIIADTEYNYEFIDKFYSDDYDLEEKIVEIMDRLEEIEKDIKNITPKMKGN